MVLVLSRNAEQSNWVPLELTRAINSKKTIIPFVVEKYDICDQFDFQLSLHQKYEAYENKQAVLKQLVNRVRALVGVQQTPVTPEANWSNTPSPLAGINGLYQHVDTDNHRDFLRFFPDGRILYICTTYPATTAAQWLGPSASACAKVSFRNNYFDTVIPLEHGKKVKLSGNFLDSSKILVSFQNTETTDSCMSASFGFANLELPKTYSAPPAKLLHIAQYNGVYQQKGKGGVWEMIRFLLDDTILYAQTDQTAEEAAKWFGGAYPVQSQNTITGKFVQAVFHLPNGKKILFTGTVSRGKFHARVTDQETKESETVDFQFARVAFSETYQASPIQLESALRYDGIYYDKDAAGLSWFYRFFPDNVVVCAKAVGSPEQVATWLNRQYSQKANYTRKDNVIEFTVKDDGKRKLQHKGTLMTSLWGIKLEIHASVNDSVFTKQLDFYTD